MRRWNPCNHPSTNQCEEPCATTLPTVLSTRRERERTMTALCDMCSEEEVFTDGHEPKTEPTGEDKRPCERYNRESIRLCECLVPPTLHSCPLPSDDAADVGDHRRAFHPCPCRVHRHQERHLSTRPKASHWHHSSLLVQKILTLARRLFMTIR